MLILIALMIWQIHDVVIMFWLSRVKNKKNFSSLDHLTKTTAIKYRNNDRKSLHVCMLGF